MESYRKNSTGFSLIEILVSISIIGILASSAIINYREFRKRVYDQVAESDYRNLKAAMTIENVREGRVLRYRFRNLTGPQRLPEPLSSILLSPRVRLLEAYKFIRPGTARRPEREVIRLDIVHLDGRFRYRLVSIN